MNNYFVGAINQQMERGRALLRRIPTTMPREFQLLEQTCRKDLNAHLDELNELINMNAIQSQPERLRKFRRIVDGMGFIETVGIASLERSNADDRFLNQMISKIRDEMNYPLLPPVVTSLSEHYYHILPKLNLLRVPLSEADFLLHLPDLYHELAHPLVVEKHEPRVQTFRKTIIEAIEVVLQYISQEKLKEERKRGPQRIQYYFQLWDRSWWKWVVELFCDLFAVFTIGPAFAWAHFHLCAKIGVNPYEVPTFSPSSHPADDARMQAMLYALEILSFKDEAGAIKKRWQELISISGACAEPEYIRCYPEQILQGLVQKAYVGVTAAGCTIAKKNVDTPIFRLLNEAWTEFWRDPAGYSDWEKKQVTELRTNI